MMVQQSKRLLRESSPHGEENIHLKLGSGCLAHVWTEQTVSIRGLHHPCGRSDQARVSKLLESSTGAEKLSIVFRQVRPPQYAHFHKPYLFDSSCFKLDQEFGEGQPRNTEQRGTLATPCRR